jgi:anti-sigma B factor antagonist
VSVLALSSVIVANEGRLSVSDGRAQLRRSPPGVFEVALQPEPAGTVVRVRGALDIASAPIAQATLAEVLQRHAARTAKQCVVVDVSGLTFIDAGGLRALVGAAIRARRVGVGFALRDARPRILGVIDIAGLSSVLPVEDYERSMAPRIAGDSPTSALSGAA